MRKVFLSLVLFMSFIGMIKGQNIDFKFQSGIVLAGVPKTQMENSISKILTVLNTAGHSGDSLLVIPKGILTIGAETALHAFWSNMHFVIDEDIVIQHCLNYANGYEVRQIPINLIPLDDSFNGIKERELTISLNFSGKITGVFMSLSNNDTRSFLENAKGVTDVSRRLEIRGFVEKFRQYYIEKDIESLDKIFADDALIITGTVIKTQSIPSMETPKVKIKYRREDKIQYLKRLANSIFKNNKYIDVKFDRISVMKCGADGKENFYGVTLHQDWSTIRYNDTKANADHPSYHDEGWLFLLWEFHDDGTPPVIHVRTWQPDELIASGVEKINMYDFKGF